MALGLAVASAFTAPPIVLASTDAGGEFGTALIAVAGALAAAAAAGGGTLLLRRIGSHGTPAIVLLVAGGAAALLFALAIARPLETAPSLGAVALVATLFTVLTAVLAELERLAEIKLPPAGLIALGFRRTPVVSLLVLALIVASLLEPGDDYHDVARTSGKPPPAVSITAAWNAWSAANCASEQDGQAIPLVIVGAHGGGIRAAYWTAAALTAVIDDPRSASASAAPSSTRCSR